MVGVIILSILKYGVEVNNIEDKVLEILKDHKQKLIRMKNFSNQDCVFLNKGRINIVTQEDDPEASLQALRTPIDKDDLNEKIDKMIDIIDNKLEYLESRYEIDSLKFFFGTYTISYAVII